MWFSSTYSVIIYDNGQVWFISQEFHIQRLKNNNNTTTNLRETVDELEKKKVLNILLIKSSIAVRKYDAGSTFIGQ